jgi:hypothetical protein
MHRMLAGLALTFCLGACTYYGSDVDMAPYDARPASSPLEPGVYCVTLDPDDAPDDAAPRPVGVTLIGAGDDCGLIEWDAETRTALSRDRPADPAKPDDTPEEAEDPDVAVLVPIEDGLYLWQSENSKETSPRYALYTLLASDTAMTAIDLITPAEYRLLAKRHPGVVIAEQPTTEKLPLEPESDPEDELPYIVSGSRSDVAALLIEASALSLRKALIKGEEPGFIVRDAGTATEPHPATPEQARAIQDLKDKAAALAARAPQGIIQE